MAEIKKKKHHLSPTMRWVDGDGRLTGEGFRLMRDIAVLVEAVNIVDGEITEDMLADLAVSASKLQDAAVVLGKLAVGSIYAHTLFVDEVVWTNAVAPNAISELSALTQVGSVSPGGTILSGTVPIDSTNNTGLLLTLTAFMDLPTANSGNFGYWRMELRRNGVVIDQTPWLYYDDNFSYQPVATFMDPTPGDDPVYSVTTTLSGGLGWFNITGGVLNVGLLKR